MSYVDRFSVSIDTELLAAFDQHIAAKGYTNRSEAIRDLVRELLADARLRRGHEPVTAILSVVCDHRVGEAPQRLRRLLREHAPLVSTTLRVMLDEHRDVEAIALQGPAGQVQALANRLASLRGLTLANLSMLPRKEPPG